MPNMDLALLRKHRFTTTLQRKASRSAREEGKIMAIIRELGEATPKQMRERTDIPQRTLFRTLKSLTKKGLINKRRWKLYALAQRSSEPTMALIEGLGIEADFFAEWARFLWQAYVTGEDYNKALTFPLENAEHILEDMREKVGEIKTNLHLECAECGGTDFETRDEKQYCAKCGTERSSE